MKSIYLTVFLLCSQLMPAQQNIQNADFELWDTLDCVVPENWSRPYCQFLGTEHAVEMTSDSYSGKYAVRLNTVYIGFAGAAVPGTLISSAQCTEVPPNECSGSPISGRPGKLTGYYKYESIKNDSALIVVQTTFYDTVLESRVITDTGSLFLFAASDYTAFEVPINSLQPQRNPDSVLIVFYSFNPLSGESEGTLWIDDLSLELTAQTVDISPEDGVYIYPNPANENLFIECPREERIEQVTLHYSNGSMGYQCNPHQTDSYQIDIRNLDPGMYTVVVELEQQVIIRKLVIL